MLVTRSGTDGLKVGAVDTHAGPMKAGLDTGRIAEQVACCVEALGAADQRVQLALFRILAKGKPVEPAQLAREVGLETSDAIGRLGRWYGVHTGDNGHIVAFQGLSVVEAPHRLQVDGRRLYAWCAWDTLFLPELIGRRGEIASTCPISGRAISLRVGPEGPTEVAPSEAVLSFLTPGSEFRDKTIESFCSFIHFFASREAAEHWTGDHPGTFVISIDDGFEIGRRANAARWGEALAEGRT